jgi:hypothetical protein
MLLGSPGDVEVLECTLPTSVARYAERLLSIDFGVRAIECGGARQQQQWREVAIRRSCVSRSALCPSRGTPSVWRYELGPLLLQNQVHPPPPPLSVVIASHSTISWANREPGAGVLFDWQLIAVARGRMYLQAHPAIEAAGQPLHLSGDRLPLLIRRANRGVFCLVLPEEDPSATVQEAAAGHAASMVHAARLATDRGWRMDDLICGRAGWVVASWGSICGDPGSVRTSSSLTSFSTSSGDPKGGPKGGPTSDAPSGAPTGATLLSSHANCPICYERFHAADTVVNLPCNHNFHAVCSGPASDCCNGICAWVASGHVTCPCCRTAIAASVASFLHPSAEPAAAAAGAATGPDADTEVADVASG